MTIEKTILDHLRQRGMGESQASAVLSGMRVDPRNEAVQWAGEADGRDMAPLLWAAMAAGRAWIEKYAPDSVDKKFLRAMFAE